MVRDIWLCTWANVNDSVRYYQKIDTVFAFSTIRKICNKSEWNWQYKTVFVELSLGCGMKYVTEFILMGQATEIRSRVISRLLCAISPTWQPVPISTYDVTCCCRHDKSDFSLTLFKGVTRFIDAIHLLTEIEVSQITKTLVNAHFYWTVIVVKTHPYINTSVKMLNQMLY